ncbi:XylR N-terminal domain-containing protein [Bacillus sp. 1P10SD]|uniref:XylR N-terminal domain-containing protein n=1 Tax=Bacillus sp. 1P10SD TaxID=3132265 RepID=UPI0039A532CC
MNNKIDVNEHLTFHTETSEIFLNKQRIILMGADSLGTLRRDLISALGTERAKGFLLRYGWNCGVENAENMMTALPFETELDWITIGPKIHAMTGHVNVEATEINFDPKTGDYFAEGYWYHSYEAEQHIKHFGFHHEPVCYTLIGQAGGYVSKHLGRKVIFKEIECIGKGDARCHWIGKPLEDWGKEIQSETHFYVEEDLELELNDAYKRIENQKEMLQRVLKINEQISNVLLKKKDLHSIISILGQHFQTSVIVEDQDFQLLASFGKYKNHDIKRFIDNPFGLQKIPINNLNKHKRTSHLSLPEQFGWAHNRLTAPIMVNNQPLGYLSLIRENVEFDEIEYIALERTATICAIQMLNEKTALETEQRIKGEFLDELIRGNPNVEDLTHRMKFIGHDLNQPHYLFLFDLRHRHEIYDELEETELLEIKKQMAESIYSQIKSFGQSCLVSSKLDQIISLVPSDTIEKVNLSVKEFGNLLVKHLGNSYQQMSIILGISSQCKHIKLYKRGYEEARKAIEIAQFKQEKIDVVAFDELGLIARLCNDKNLAELKSFALDILEPLVIYDQKSSSELLKTLFYYFENQGNVLKTARNMMLSAGSIKYRIKRIEEITSLNLLLSKDFFDAQVALQILIFLGLVIIK